MTRLIRTPLLTILAALAMVISAGSARADAQDPAEFVSENAQEVISTLQALNEGEAELDVVRAQFRERVQTLADMERITNFVLGRYRRTASEEQLAEFREVFREYAFSVYESELTNYAGQTLEVTNTVTRRPGDYVVETRVFGGPDGTEYEVYWRVLEGDEENLQVVDVQVMGIWLAQTQRDQITSVIDNNRGDVSAATELLRSKLESDELPGADDLAQGQ